MGEVEAGIRRGENVLWSFKKKLHKFIYGGHEGTWVRAEWCA